MPLTLETTKKFLKNSSGDKKLATEMKSYDSGMQVSFHIDPS